MKNGPLGLVLLLLFGAGLAFGLRLLAADPAPEEARHEKPDRAPRQEPGASAAPTVAPTEDPPEVFPAIASDCVDRNNEATRLLAEGDLPGAVALFRECVEEVPEQVIYRRNLCEALVRLARGVVDTEHDLESGIEHLDEALALEVERPDRDALESLLARWREQWAVSQDDLVEPSLYFEVAYDPDRDDLLYRVHEVMDLLDRAYVEMTEWFLVDPVRENGRKIRVTFYDSEEFDRVTGLGDWAGGVFDGTIRLAVDQLQHEEERWSRVARHELVHAFVRELGGDKVPGWLNEGLAQWLDYSSFGNSRRREQVDNAHARLRGHTLFPIERLAGSLASWEDKEEISRAYAQSLAMVAFIERYYGRDALLAMTARGREERGVETAFRERTGIELGTVLVDLELELSR